MAALALVRGFCAMKMGARRGAEPRAGEVAQDAQARAASLAKRPDIGGTEKKRADADSESFHTGGSGSGIEGGGGATRSRSNESREQRARATGA